MLTTEAHTTRSGREIYHVDTYLHERYGQPNPVKGVVHISKGRAVNLLLEMYNSLNNVITVENLSKANAQQVDGDVASHLQNELPRIEAETAYIEYLAEKLVRHSHVENYSRGHNIDRSKINKERWDARRYEKSRNPTYFDKLPYVKKGTGEVRIADIDGSEEIVEQKQRFNRKYLRRGELGFPLQEIVRSSK
jgi:hypothetical protein